MDSFLTGPMRKRIWGYVVADAAMVACVFLISYSFRIVFIENKSLLALPQRVSWIVYIGILIHLICFYVFGLYYVSESPKRKLLFIDALFSVITASVGVSLLSYAFPAQKVGRILNIIHVVIMVGAVYFSRLFYSGLPASRVLKKLIIIGWNPLVAKLAGSMEVFPSGYKLAGVIAPTGDVSLEPESFGLSVPVHDSIESGLQTQGLQAVVITQEMKELGRYKKILVDLKFQGMEIFDGPTFYERLFRKVPVSSTPVDWLLFKSQLEPFQPKIYSNLKRFLDCSISICVLALSLPFFLAVSILIRIDSKGPVFFRQERLGQFECPFTLLKFRTMVDDAEKDSGPCWASECDPRFTRIGNFLRKTRLDELPQFINVLKGEMSLVGPRPIREHFADLFAEKFPFYRLRFKVKPGITGWAQVNMDYVRTEQDQYEKLEYEFYYMYHQSLFLDLFILLKTAQSMVKMRGG